MGKKGNGEEENEMGRDQFSLAFKDGLLLPLSLTKPGNSRHENGEEEERMVARAEGRVGRLPCLEEGGRVHRY